MAVLGTNLEWALGSVPMAEREQKRSQEKGSNVTLEVTLARAYGKV